MPATWRVHCPSLQVSLPWNHSFAPELLSGAHWQVDVLQSSPESDNTSIISGLEWAKQHRKSGYLVIGNLRLRCWLVLNITLTTLLPFPAYPPKEITSNNHLPLSSQKRHSFKKGGPRGIDCNGEISLCGACAGAPGKLMVKFNSTSLQIQASCWLKSAQIRSNYKDVHNWYTIIKHTL